MTITEFLLARVAEDEDEARALLSEWEASPPRAYDAAQVGWLDAGSPERVLAECEAKRRIVELRYSWNLQAERSPEPPFGPILQAQVITADTVLRTLASVYAAHEDFREEWRA